MNNSTITIYKDDKYTNIYHSFDLEKTNFKKISDHFCCINIVDPIISANLCGYEKYCGKPKENPWANEWADHFKLFKVSCRVGRMESLISPEDEKQLAEAMRKKLSTSSASMSVQKEEEIKKQQLHSQTNSATSAGSPSPYVAKIAKTENLGLKAISKEMKLGDLIRSEEQQKEEQEVHSIVQKLKVEKEKAECLTRTIKARDLDATVLADKRYAESEIKEIKVEAVKEVKAKRAKLKKLIGLMRAKTKLRKMKYQQELTALRSKMAMQQMKSNKVGKIEYCQKGKIHKTFREKYCDKNFIDDFVNNRDCKTDDFCYMCCENEFGNMHIDKREICYNMCDRNEKKEIKKAKKKVEKKKKKIKKKSPEPFMWQ